MQTRNLVSYVGAFLVVAGVFLAAFQMILGLIDHERLNDLIKQCSYQPGGSISCNTNVVGFGLIVVGAILLALTLPGSRKPKAK